MTWTIDPDERIDGDAAPPPETLAAYAAEIKARVRLPRDPRIGLLFSPRCPPDYVDLVADNAACVVHELRERGKSKAEVRADVDAFAGPFLRGLLEWSNANGGDNPHVHQDVKGVVTSLLDAIVDMTDPAWSPA